MNEIVIVCIVLLTIAIIVAIVYLILTLIQISKTTKKLEETIDKVKNLQNIRFAYIDKKVFDENKIAKGLFVKLNSKETLGIDLYFNFGLEFVEEQLNKWREELLHQN